ncbi:MAG: NADH-quinone oxidoreductase subunit NuoE [Bacteroidales bacterium]|nr:NADH-quinone oxidoreductase subunit NuoE [Bacteroidales bacterium]
MIETKETDFTGFEGRQEELIPLLQKVQREEGFISDDSMQRIADFAGVPLSKVYGVATFYAQFRFKPKGKKHIMMCRGTACHVKGAKRVQEEIETQLGIKEGETSHDLAYSLENVACIGACSLAPCVMVNDEVEAKLNADKIKKIFTPKKEKK